MTHPSETDRDPDEPNEGSVYYVRSPVTGVLNAEHAVACPRCFCLVPVRYKQGHEHWHAQMAIH